MEDSDFEEEVASEAGDGEGLTVCSFCHKSYKCIKDHIIHVHLAEKKCLFCGDEFGSGPTLYLHLAHVHRQLIGLMPMAPEQLESTPTVKVDQQYLESVIEKRKIEFGGTKLLKLDEFLSWWDEENERGRASLQVLTPETLQKKFKPPKGEEREIMKDDEIPEPLRTSDVKKSPEMDYTHLAVACYYLYSKKAREVTFKRRNFVYVLKVVNRRGLRTVEAHIRRVGLNHPWTIVLTIAIYDEKSKKLPADGYEMWSPSFIAKIVLLANGQMQIFLVPNVQPDDETHFSFLHYRSSIEEIKSKDPTLNLPFNQQLSWEDKAKYKCRHCRTFFGDLLRRRVHEIIHTSGACPFKGCPEKYQVNLDEEFIDHVLGHQPLLCEEQDCDAIFFRKRCLEKHAFKHSTIRFHCSECEKSYKREDGLKRHVKAIHESDGTLFECDACDKKFSTKGSLKNHTRHDHSKASGAAGEIEMHVRVHQSKLLEELDELRAEVASQKVLLEAKDLDLQQTQEELARSKEELARSKEELARSKEELTRERQRRGFSKRLISSDEDESDVDNPPRVASKKSRKML